MLTSMLADLITDGMQTISSRNRSWMSQMKNDVLLHVKRETRCISLKVKIENENWRIIYIGDSSNDIS